ncbi:MAG TPA: phosphatase PAP2 family protein [Gemmatimonadales bacterium]|nr:phosphatase PAP2 family protein [Gemmatimonadales bacterium]
MAVVALLHLLAYLAVTRVNAGRPEHALWNLSTPMDVAIPHLPFTWPLYWLVYLFVPFAGAVALLRMSEPAFRRAIVAYSGMLLVGAGVQLLIPARAPWPASPAPLQEFYHSSGLVLPYANLPSMHVAFATLTAAMLATVVLSPGWRLAAMSTALLITVGTLTLKEHFVLDALAGVLLAFFTWRWWHAQGEGRPVRGEPG